MVGITAIVVFREHELENCSNVLIIITLFVLDFHFKNIMKWVIQIYISL